MSKLLVIGDTPTENTGFACVVRNLVRHWRCEMEIDIWGMNYTGWPHEYPHRIFPAGQEWYAPKNLSRLLNHIKASDYTHIWILQDLFLLSDRGLPNYLKLVCREKNIRLMTYFPVDAPLEPEWLQMVSVSDAAGTFTRYGQAQAMMALGDESPKTKIEIIPHGVDTTLFEPLPLAQRRVLREEWFPPDWQAATILVNVNRNERRKAMVHSLHVLRELKWRTECDDRLRSGFKLFLHCQPKNLAEQTDLKLIGAAMGLEYGKDWLTPEEQCFERGVGQFAPQQVNDLYNAADICITTTLGEGWGLSLTEAAAAGMHVVGPNHTSLPEIAEIVGPRMELVRISHTSIANVNDNSRLRYAVDIGQMAKTIEAMEGLSYPRLPLSDAARETLSWERIARRWLELF